MKRIHQTQLLTTCAVLVCATFTSTTLFAEVNTMSAEVTAYEFLLGSSSDLMVIGVEDSNHVIVRRPDNKTEVISPDQRELRITEKKMHPQGRITICRTQARSERESRINKDIVAQMTGSDIQLEMGETYFTFELVADRDLDAVYLVLFLYHPDHPDDKTIEFGRIGDLQAGEFVKREITFPNTTVTEGMEYRFEFFSGGAPLEMYMLPDVAMNPASRSLQIPWSARLDCYLRHGEDAKRNAHPRPWKMGFQEIDLEGYKARGAADMKIKIRVKADGSCKLIEGDPRMTDKEVEALSHDIAQWKFFPELEKGKPTAKLVAAPLKL